MPERASESPRAEGIVPGFMRTQGSRQPIKAEQPSVPMQGPSVRLNSWESWPRSPEATASRKVAERLSDCARAGKSTACGVVSLRRHCPDQVPGGRRSASELSPTSQQPFLPAPGLPGARSVQLPRSPRRQYTRCMARVTALRVESPACTGRTSCFSEARGLAGRGTAAFMLPGLAARPFSGGGRGQALSRTDR